MAAVSNSRSDVRAVAEAEHPDAYRLAEKIKIWHGTNSSLLAIVSSTDCTLLPTGRLLQEGIAPMSGELARGMEAVSVNQRWLSADTNISRCWEYAVKKSKTFEPPTEEEFLQLLAEHFERLKSTCPDHDDWDPLMVNLLRLKQWSPEVFARYCRENTEQIEAIKKEILSRISRPEMRVLEVLNLPIEKLRAASEGDQEVLREINENYCYGLWSWQGTEWWVRPRLDGYVRTLLNMDEACFRSRSYSLRDLRIDLLTLRLFGAETIEKMLQIKEDVRPLSDDWFRMVLVRDFPRKFGLPPTVDNILQKVRERIETQIRHNMRPFQTRYERLLRILDPAPPRARLGDREKRLITASFPVLLASTHIRPMRPWAEIECNFPKGKLGEELDLMFVLRENMGVTEEWLKEHSLIGRVSLYPAELALEIAQLPAIPRPSVYTKSLEALSPDQHKELNCLLSDHVFPHYRKPYPGAGPRVYHGVPHAARVAFFSIVLRNLYLQADKPCPPTSIYLPLDAGMHDAARENDGVDIWDRQSAAMAEKLLQTVKCPRAEITTLVDALANKDDKDPSSSLERRHIHDADAIEIMRCLRDPATEFRHEELWAFQDLDADTVYDLVREARHLIQLTEQQPIKQFLEETSEPYKALLQILEATQDRFPLIASQSLCARAPFRTPSDLILPEEVLAIVQR